MAKKVFILLLAVNALLVLFIVMNRELSIADSQSMSFIQEGKAVEVVSRQLVKSKRPREGECGEVGPAVATEVIEQASKRLVARNIANELYEDDVVVSTDYWVIIPPRPSEKQAYRLLKQLQLANIDSYIVTQGDYANAISLGLFTVKSSAYRIKDKMVSAGFETVVQEIQRTQKRYWLEFSGDSAIVSDALLDLNLNISHKSCKSR
ncbi:hypothetical protein [Litoribrevibacter albus]|uniref:SPOR domain-containing protein n=1 Tax=Litoribrevibacter albus TaxID=1473156 RepID=A0AA37W6R6_9GAMM|nr:hypothetical protein [Litoribrevibacter albus]GLQ30463.1 hypothetical protein GCM10007876_09410 [Litoribrevibacter albus]